MTVHVVLIEAIVSCIILVVITRLILVVVIFELMRWQSLVKHLLVQLVLVLQVELVIWTWLIWLLKNWIATFTMLVIVII